MLSVEIFVYDEEYEVVLADHSIKGLWINRKEYWNLQVQRSNTIQHIVVQVEELLENPNVNGVTVVAYRSGLVRATALVEQLTMRCIVDIG